MVRSLIPRSFRDVRGFTHGFGLIHLSSLILSFRCEKTRLTQALESRLSGTYNVLGYWYYGALRITRASVPVLQHAKRAPRAVKLRASAQSAW